MVTKERQLQENRFFFNRSIILTLEPWSIWSRVYEAVSHRQECTLCRSQIYFKLWWIQQRRNKMCSSGSGGATEEEMAKWSELFYIWHLAAKVFTIAVLDWSGLSAQTIYWWTFMNTVINLWGSNDLFIYRSTTIFSRRNLFHEGGYTQRRSPRCRVISQFIGSHWLTNLLKP